MKNRFKRMRICSSDNYELSKRVYLFFMHTHNMEPDIREDKLQPYVSCFGSLKRITRNKAEQIKHFANIVWK